MSWQSPLELGRQDPCVLENVWFSPSLDVAKLVSWLIAPPAS